MQNNPEQDFLQAQAKRFARMLLLLRIQEESYLPGAVGEGNNASAEQIISEIEKSETLEGNAPIREKLIASSLSPVEVDAYLLRLALDEVPGFDRQCAVITDGGYPDRSERRFLEDLLNAYHGPAVARCFEENLPLFAAGLLSYEPEEVNRSSRYRRITVNKTLSDLLLNRSPVASFIRLNPVDYTAPVPYLEPAKLSQLETSIEKGPGDIKHMIHGPKGAGKRRLARYLASGMGRRILEIDLSRIEDRSKGRELERTMQAASFLKLTLLIHGVEICPEQKDCPVRSVLNTQLPGCRNPVFITAQDKLELDTNVEHLTTVNLKTPNTSTREKMWSEISTVYELSDEVSPRELARMFHITGQPIREALREAHGNTPAGEKISRGELFRICRGKSVSRLSELASMVEPKFSWDDLVLAPAAMHLVREIEADIRADARIFEEWYMDRVATAAKGHNILFTGIPGTGKTMAASIIASELGLELYKIDLSRVSSKYVGDVEKNLAALFDEAEKANAALFFDEADSLFGKRGNNESAQGHYVNQQIGYLLQRLEAFKGIAFMATNLEKNIDKAFERRFNYVVPFTFPETAERIRIWERAFSPEAPIADDVDFTLLGTEFEATGANIKSIALKASRRAAADEKRSPLKVERFDIIYATVREFDKIVKGWDLDYKGPFRPDIDRVRALLKGD